MPEVTRVVRSLDPELPAYDVATMESRLYDSLARRRLSMLLLVVFAVFATLLAGIGTYGLIAYWADQRRREIGIAPGPRSRTAPMRSISVSNGSMPACEPTTLPKRISPD